MKYLVIAGFVIAAFSYNAIAQTNYPNFSIEVENDSSTVSPGGYLKVKVQGDSNSDDFEGDIRLQVNTNVASIIESISYQYGNVYYHSSQSKKKPRFFTIKISDDIETTPQTVSLNLHLAYNKKVVFDTTTFYLVDGVNGHRPENVLSGHYYVNIYPKENEPSFYEIFCISSLAGYCSINIKNGDYDDGKYHGHAQILIQNHTCSDKGFPGTSRLDVRDPLVFDASKMIKKIENFTAPDHHKEVDLGACIISSNNPFFIRQVKPAKQKKSTPSL